MSHSQDTINKLISKRSARYSQGLTQLDAELLSKSHSVDLVLNYPGMNQYRVNHKTFAKFMQSNFDDMRSLAILEEKTTGTADFTAWEMLVQIETKVDVTELDIKAGDKYLVRGVALQWWKWEGLGDFWDGDLTDEGIEGWKIVREHDYMINLVNLRKESMGGSERVFDF